MPAPRKYDQETRDRAVRMYQERRRDHPAESALQSRKRVGELLDIRPATMRGWIERVEALRVRQLHASPRRRRTLPLLRRARHHRRTAPNLKPLPCLGLSTRNGPTAMI